MQKHKSTRFLYAGSYSPNIGFHSCFDPNFLQEFQLNLSFALPAITKLQAFCLGHTH